MSGAVQVAGNSALYKLSDDATLLKAFGHGDDQAFSMLVTRYQQMVKNACRRQVPAAEVDDCVQAVFLVLVRRPKAAERAPALAAWLLRVCHFVCRDARRAEKNRTKLMNTLPANESRVQNNDLEPDAAILTQLDEALLKLPDKQRAAVILQAENKTTQEIAQRLNVTVENAYKLTNRGMERLRKYFARKRVPITAATLLTCMSQNFAQEFTSIIPSAKSLLSLAKTTTASSLAEGACMHITIAAIKSPLIIVGLVATIGATGLAAIDVSVKSDPQLRAEASTPSAEELVKRLVQSDEKPINQAGKPNAEAPRAEANEKNAVDNGITLSLKEVSGKTLAAFIKRQSGLSVIIDGSFDEKTITYEAKNKPVKQALDEIAELLGGTAQQARGRQSEDGKEIYFIGPKP